MGSENKSQRLKLVCLNTIQYMIYLVYMLLSVPTATFYVMAMAPFSTHRSSVKRVRRLIEFWGMGLSFLTLPFVRVCYKSSSKNDKRKPCIYVCNHRSFLDAFLVAHPCWRHESVQVVNIWPFRIPVIGAIAKIAGYLNVNSMPFEKFSLIAKKMIGEGVSIVSFPEGTRSKDKTMGPFHSSMFRIALQARCLIVPICISGNETVLRRGNIMLRPGLIKINELPALQWEEYKNMTPVQLKNKVRKTIIMELSAMDAEIGMI